MFAVEIDFHDGISPPETILVRRSNAIIGSSDVAHVVIEGAASSANELRLVRGLGREFSCYPVRRPGHSASPPTFLEGTYHGQADVKLGDLTLHITALDIDLVLAAGEFADKGALRILRAAASRPSPVFPAVAVLGPRPLFVSFPEGETLLIGRSRKCGLRLDSPDVSNEHARIGVSEGGSWVEDVGSTNGTYIGSERISGRRQIEPGNTIRLGAEFELAAVLREEDLMSLSRERSTSSHERSEQTEYPSVIAYGAEVRPARTIVREGTRLTLGRDPASDIWVNSAHISRQHLSISWFEGGRVEVCDYSSNGTFVDGKRLEREVPIVVDKELFALDLSEGVFVGVCFNESDEKYFLDGETKRADGLQTQEGPETVLPESLQVDAEAALARGDSAVFSSERAGVQDFNASFSSYSASEVQEGDFSGARDAGFTTNSNEELISDSYARELFDEDLFDEEILHKPYFRGVSRVLLAVLIVVLVVCTLVLFIGVFTGIKV